MNNGDVRAQHMTPDPRHEEGKGAERARDQTAMNRREHYSPELRLLPQTGAAVLQRGRHARRAARCWRKGGGTWPGKLRESYTGNVERLPGKAGDKASVRVKRGKEVY